MHDDIGTWQDIEREIEQELFNAPRESFARSGAGIKSPPERAADPPRTDEKRRLGTTTPKKIGAQPRSGPSSAQSAARKSSVKPPTDAPRQSAEPPQSTAQAPPEQSQAAKPPSKKKKRRRRPLVGFLIKLVLLAAILYGVFTFVLGMHICHGNRMHPFIMDGDLIVTYKLEAYHVGDVVVYESPLTGEKTISRIAAIGENEIQITDVGELLINGSIPEENVFYATKKLNDSTVSFPYRMSGGGYFLLDDYRTIGKDSRMFGEVTEDALLGKIVYVFRRRGI